MILRHGDFRPTILVGFACVHQLVLVVIPFQLNTGHRGGGLEVRYRNEKVFVIALGQQAEVGGQHIPTNDTLAVVIGRFAGIVAVVVVAIPVVPVAVLAVLVIDVPVVVELEHGAFRIGVFFCGTGEVGVGFSEADGDFINGTRIGMNQLAEVEGVAGPGVEVQVGIAVEVDSLLHNGLAHTLELLMVVQPVHLQKLGDIFFENLDHPHVNGLEPDAFKNEGKLVRIRQNNPIANEPDLRQNFGEGHQFAQFTGKDSAFATFNAGVDEQGMCTVEAIGGEYLDAVAFGGEAKFAIVAFQLDQPAKLLSANGF